MPPKYRGLFIAAILLKNSGKIFESECPNTEDSIPQQVVSEVFRTFDSADLGFPCVGTTTSEQVDGAAVARLKKLFPNGPKQ